MANIFEQRKEKGERILSSMRNIKHLIAVGSGKGGVGKSTVAANLAIALAQKGFRVGLADADIYGPSIPTLFNIDDNKVMGTEVEGKSYILPFEKFGIKLMSIGFFVEKDKPLIWRGPMASNTLNQLLVETLWGELDYLIIDTPPGTGDIQLTLTQDFPLSAAMFVCTPQQLAVADVRRAVNMYKNEKINIPILGLVENMAYFTPKELPNNKYYIFGKDGAQQLAQELNLELLVQIPISEDVSLTNDNGNPIALDYTSMEGKTFGELATIVSQRLK
ncbi:MAG: Mrp/NBP35 family ATP-binding protein [Bacteroidales bacterium]|jgi:ATP-binding protein involved in chromosome partitioning|nr:Mrp/NBP35 family ATP-binding protein [Bacteroidales bacterium]